MEAKKTVRRSLGPEFQEVSSRKDVEGTKAVAVVSEQKIGDLMDFFSEVLPAPQPAGSIQVPATATNDLSIDLSVQNGVKETVKDSVQPAGTYSPMRSRRDVHPPKRLMYDTLGKSAEEQIHTICRLAPGATLPIVNWVGGKSALTSGTNGWDTAIALACSKIGYELTDGMYQWFRENPEVCKYL